MSLSPKTSKHHGSVKQITKSRKAPKKVKPADLEQELASTEQT